MWDGLSAGGLRIPFGGEWDFIAIIYSEINVMLLMLTAWHFDINVTLIHIRIEYRNRIG